MTSLNFAAKKEAADAIVTAVVDGLMEKPASTREWDLAAREALESVTGEDYQDLPEYSDTAVAAIAAARLDMIRTDAIKWA